MPEIVILPHRGRDSGLSFTTEQLDEIHESLKDLENGQAVVLSKADADGKPFAKDSAARNYARVFANAYQERFAHETDTDEDGNTRRLISTHAIPAVNAQGKPTGKFLAAVSNNTGRAPVRQVFDGPSRSDLMREVREWRKTHPRDRTFRNYTRWDYETLRNRVNEVTGYNDGIYVPPVETPEMDADASQNGNGETDTDTESDNVENTENVGA